MSGALLSGLFMIVDVCFLLLKTWYKSRPITGVTPESMIKSRITEPAKKNHIVIPSLPQATALPKKSDLVIVCVVLTLMLLEMYKATSTLLPYGFASIGNLVASILAACLRSQVRIPLLALVTAVGTGDVGASLLLGITATFVMVALGLQILGVSRNHMQEFFKLLTRPLARSPGTNELVTRPHANLVQLLARILLDFFSDPANLILTLIANLQFLAMGKKSQSECTPRHLLVYPRQRTMGAALCKTL
jgi:hypothetical protein